MRAGIRNKREYRESLVSGIFDALFSRIDRWKDNTERERCDTCRLRAVNVSRHTSAISRGRGFYFRRISLALSTSTIFRYTSSIPLIQTFVFRVTFPTLLRRSVSFFFSFSLLLFISCSFFDNPIYRSSIFLTSTWFAGKKSSNLEKTLIFLSSRKLVGGIGSIILFVHSGLYFLNKSNDESLYSTFQSSTEFSFFLENSSRLSPLSLCFFDVSFFDICTAWRILFLQSNGSLCFELGSKRSFLFCLLKFSRGDSAKNRWPWKVRSLIFFDSRKEERGNKRILNFIRTIESVD